MLARSFTDSPPHRLARPASSRAGDREIGGFKKKWKNHLPVALLYPNHYQVGMSSLGLQIVYQLLNEIPEVVAERVFYPEDAGGGQPRSVESGRLLADFPLILCSVSFEHDYLGLLEMLAAAGIPLLARQRTAAGLPVGPLAAGGMPLIIAGGVAAMINPEPLAPCIDMFVIGEAEPVLAGIMAHLLDQLLDQRAPADRERLLAGLAAAFPCCYVPHLYTPSYHPDGTLAGVAVPAGLPARIKRVAISNTGQMAGHSHILTPDAEFANLYLTELGRGCSRGCRFCAAGFIYRPPRLWPAAAIIEAITARPPAANRIGLLGMEMAAAEDLAAISRYLLAAGCALSFSSLRADVVGPQLLQLLMSSELKTAALAPDGGSQRLRQVINKGISEGELLAAAADLVTAGIKNLKLYFMVGLPTETDEDLEELIALIIKIKKLVLPAGKARGSLARLTLSVNCFIPKPWTPFQFHPFAEVAVLRKKLSFLRKRLTSLPNLNFKAEKPENAYFQAILARGDRRVGEVLAGLAISGRNWQQAFKEAGLCPETYALRSRGRDELFPWEIIDHGLTRGYLWAEYQKGLAAKPTPACEPDICQRCGVCK